MSTNWCLASQTLLFGAAAMLFSSVVIAADPDPIRERCEDRWNRCDTRAENARDACLKANPGSARCQSAYRSAKRACDAALRKCLSRK